MQKECEGIEQILFPFAKEAGLEKWIEYDEGSKMYFLTPDMEDEIIGEMLLKTDHSLNDLTKNKEAVDFIPAASDMLSEE